MRHSTFAINCVRRSVGRSVGRVTHSFDNLPGAPYWPTWPCFTFTQLADDIGQSKELRPQWMIFDICVEIFDLDGEWQPKYLTTVLQCSRWPCCYSFEPYNFFHHVDLCQILMPFLEMRIFTVWAYFFSHPDVTPDIFALCFNDLGHYHLLINLDGKWQCQMLLPFVLWHWM